MRMARLAAVLRPLAAPCLVALVVLGSWQMAVVALRVPDYLLPGPLAITQALLQDWQTLTHALLMTLKVTLLALAVAVVLGVLLAFAFVQSRWIERSLFPYAVLLQVTPIVAIAPLIIIWIRNTTKALTVCAAIIAIFPIISNTTLGLRSVNPMLLQLYSLYRASRWQVLWRLRVPSALPSFCAALRISSGLALVGAVVAEFVAGTGGNQAGLAYEILQAGYRLEIPRLFAALLLISLAGLALFLLAVALTRLLLGRWHESERVLVTAAHDEPG